ncbi:uncharacterized protein CIMG_11220 [Coccidioides immitis RS]|uniref:Uncharacterized protein n=4 Tax=Coccidioides immitis TaxID=5501 RepID=J3KCA8_COCIM|nr:uncharacterized protein CIMG_11220 [Coccidioides immitis RS]EAS32848.3 hypothetical protein CIMG_11220 [Coccidioides immitis RS]KMP08116.1 hypothetical protein CIRG_07797 [Coccidioides immitis RMSCC 2394]KMU79600.1 hypothetical protein CISG_02018 [Coccidioides immitis RMSCC 3703]KMU91513.1 hypothetical protein CIHG_09265 [Coccidioides immitis H538.4]
MVVIWRLFSPNVFGARVLTLEETTVWTESEHSASTHAISCIHSSLEQLSIVLHVCNAVGPLELQIGVEVTELCPLAEIRHTSSKHRCIDLWRPDRSETLFNIHDDA